MPTLATGISRNKAAPRARAAGSRTASAPTFSRSGRRLQAAFSLMEIMIVVFIIGLVTATMVITFSGDTRDTELDKEAERIDALFAYAREQAELQTRDYGFRMNRLEYSFVVFDPLANEWRLPQEDDALREREIPAGIIPGLVIEGRGVVLDSRKPKVQDFKPQVMIFANGDITSFEITLEREGTDDRARIYSDEDTHVRLLLPGQTEPSGPPVRTVQSR
jgi:general secretion pathway protein H